MEMTGTRHGEYGAMAFTNQPGGDLPGAGASGSASKKSNKGKGARKSDAKPTKDAEADSPVASIEENDDDMNSSQKTIVDPDVAEALAKREAARQAKSEKMKAITKGTVQESLIRPPTKEAKRAASSSNPLPKITVGTSTTAKAKS